MNEATGAYAGDLAALPNMVNGLSLVLALIPAMLALASFFIYKFGYKITPELRKTMTEELNRRHQAKEEING